MNIEQKEDFLKDQIHKHPYGSKRYNIIKNQMERLLIQKPGYDKYCICMDNNNNNYPEGIFRVTENSSSICPSRLFTFNNGIFSFIERYKAEYNFKYRHLVIGVLITDGTDIILLNCKKGRVKNNYTMIGGHVDYDSSCRRLSQANFLRENAMREFHEEISIEYKDADIFLFSEKFSLTPSYFICTKDNTVDVDHIGFIYVIRLDHPIDKFNIKSNEPEKHDIVKLKLTKESYYDNIGKLDNWTKGVIEDLVQ